MHAAIDAFLSRHELLRHGCERLAEDFRRIAALDASGASGAEMVVRSGYAVLALASSMVMELLEHSVDCPVSDSDQRLDAALHVLRDNVSRRLSVQEVALQAGTSERNLRRLFRKHCNCAVVGKANELRMQEAARMVATMPFIKIEAVALACGFDAVSDFSMAFKRFHGVSPGSYRNSGGTVRVPVGR